MTYPKYKINITNQFTCLLKLEVVVVAVGVVLFAALVVVPTANHTKVTSQLRVQTMSTHPSD